MEIFNRRQISTPDSVSWTPVTYLSIMARSNSFSFAIFSHVENSANLTPILSSKPYLNREILSSGCRDGSLMTAIGVLL